MRTDFLIDVRFPETFYTHEDDNPFGQYSYSDFAKPKIILIPQGLSINNLNRKLIKSIKSSNDGAVT